MGLYLVVQILLLLFLAIEVKSVTIGTITQARIASNAPSTWLYNQSSWSQCMCYSLQHSSIVALNSFALNLSCRLFSNLSSFPFQVINDPNVTVYLLQPLQAYTPCCSNLTWLLTQVKSVTSTLNITSITGVALDTTRNRLGIVGSTRFQLVSANSFTLLNLTANLPTNAQPVTYYQDLFYVGIFPVLTPSALSIYSALNLSKVGTINFTQGSPERIVWLFNDTQVCILLQRNSSTALAYFYNWPSNTLNKSVSLSIINAYGLGKAPNDDSFVYITDGSWGGFVWRLKTSSPYNFTQIASSLNSNESPTAVTVDTCNRLWVVFAGFGVRIYNLSSFATLATWNLTSTYPTIYDLALTNQYQLYLADKSTSKLARYGSALQCTN